MITGSKLIYKNRADKQQDCSLGNILFRIAGTIGVATMNGYAYGFGSWPNQEFFKNRLPRTLQRGKPYQIPANHFGYDFGFSGFNIPDNRQIEGELGDERYFKHCEGLIRHYFDMQELCEPFKDCILVHYRNYPAQFTAWNRLNLRYYNNALKQLPDKRVIVVTDNIKVAKNVLKWDCEYTSNTPIEDFYLLAHADYIVMANSTFSWWGAWLSQAKTVAPKEWFVGDLAKIDLSYLYLPNWIKI